MPTPDSSGPASNFRAVTPSDSANFGFTARGLYVGTTGNVAVVGTDNVAVTFTAVPAGVTLAVNCIRVNSTNTTASNIVALL